MRNNIENLRKAKGMTQKDLAAELDTSQQHIARLEKGDRKLTADWIEKFCTILSCQPGELIDFSTTNTSSKNVTTKAQVIGAIETKFSNMVRKFDDDEKYDITFKPAKKTSDNNYFALVVEGGGYKNYPENSELIFAETASTQATQALAENEKGFLDKSTSNPKEHKFKIGNKIIHASLIKSIRNE